MTKTPHTHFSYPERLSATIRPQDNFFGYVNQRWLDANPIPPSESRWGTFNVLNDEAMANLKHIYEELQDQPDLAEGSVAQQARDLYHTGMHVDDYEPAHLDFIAQHFAIIDDITNASDMARVIGELQRRGMSGPWRVIVDADDKNSAAHILRLHQGGLTLPDRDYYLKTDAKMKSVRKAYKEHLAQVFAAFPDIAPSAGMFVDAVWGFEMQMAKISRSRVDLRDVESNYNKTHYSDLKKSYSRINWPAYAEAMHWQPDNKLSVDQPEFLEYINEQFHTRPLEDWKIYLKWHFLLPYYGRISEKYAKLKFEFFGKILAGTNEMMPLWKRVVLNVDDALGEAVGELYVKKHFSETSKKQVLHMVELIRDTYKQRIQALDWMRDDTKKYAIRKLEAIKVLIGYPDKWRDFSTLHISRSSYIENLVAAEEFGNDYWLDRLHKPTSRSDWFMYPQMVNAYHDPNRLVICFPAAILQPPFFDAKAPLAANLGGIGTVIGHELTHGFDDQGCQFDAEGNVKQWQTPHDRKAFDARAQLVIDHADHFEVLPGLNLRGKLVIGESIADLGGIEIAHQALVAAEGDKLDAPGADGLSPHQLFFISYASTECGHSREERSRQLALSDPHPNEHFRTNGILQHVDSFYQVFDITEGDKLYRMPELRAKIW